MRRASGDRDTVWPPGFERAPEDEWLDEPLDELALRYDALKRTGWYANLDPTVEFLRANLGDREILVDYSGGTGILEERLLAPGSASGFGIVIVDSSPKLLRLSLDKFRDEPRVALRLLAFIKGERRLEHLDECLGRPLGAGGVDAIASTNAIHLYYGLLDTLRGWSRALKPGGRAHVQSGNIWHPEAREGEWIIDETVAEIHRVAMDIVSQERRYAKYRHVLDDTEKLAQYAALTNKYFLPVRPLEHYLRTLEQAGFQDFEVQKQNIEVKVDEWLALLELYHEGVLGWVGGAEKIEGRPPGEQAVKDRLDLMRKALARLFGKGGRFTAYWTYISCRNAR
jgi:SAM-dependent methyltransferase